MGGRVLAGRYELLEPVGGSSWRALDTELRRDVLVRLGAAADVPGAALSHPNIERVFDQGEEEGERYAVLEHLPGGALADRGELTDEAAADVAAALAYAHALGVAHGSLTDRAIRFDADGRAKVTGFGGGDPAEDVRAFGGLLAKYGSTAVASVAAAAQAGELDAAELVERLPKASPPPAPPVLAPDEEATTLIQRPAVVPRRYRRPALVLVAAALAAAGIGAAFLAASGDSTEPPTESLSVPVPTASATTAEETEPPAPSTTEPTTTEETEPPTTETQPPTTETEQPVPTTEPLPTVEPPPTTVEPPTTEIVPP